MTQPTQPTQPTEPTDTTAPDLRGQLFAAQDWCADLVAATPDSALHAPTPCDDFDVRLLVGHISMVLEKVIGFGTDRRDVMKREGVEETPAYYRELGERFAAEAVDGRAPAERAERLRGFTQRARAAWTDDVLDADVRLGWGPVVPGRVVAGIYLMEALAHGADLAVATGQDVEAPAAVAEAGLAAARVALPAEGREHFPFGDPVTPAPDAGPTEQLANWTGRRTR